MLQTSLVLSLQNLLLGTGYIQTREIEIVKHFFPQCYQKQTLIKETCGKAGKRGNFKKKEMWSTFSYPTSQRWTVNFHLYLNKTVQYIATSYLAIKTPRKEVVTFMYWALF